MTSYLDQAWHVSSDPLEAPMIPFAGAVRTGLHGCPQIEIDPNLLSVALELCPKTQVAKMANCSARIIRWRQQDYGILISRSNQQQTGCQEEVLTPLEEITDEQLDQHLAIIIQDFPNFGRRLATASLRAIGVIVPEHRVGDSLAHVNGTPGTFGGRRVHRRRYKVAGANSLWHHDGQHGICFLYSH